MLWLLEARTPRPVGCIHISLPLSESEGTVAEYKGKELDHVWVE